MKSLRKIEYFPFVVGFLIMFMSGSVTAKPNQTDPNSTDVFITIGDYVITEAVFMAALRSEARQRFYHGRINAERFAQLKQDVTELLVNNALVMLEAEKRKLEPPEELIQAELIKLEQRYATDQNWPKFRDQYLKQVKDQLISRERIHMMEEYIRSKAEPIHAEVKAFYEQNPTLFTLPATRRVGLILIKVEPSAPADKWQEADSALLSLRQRALIGESFESLAKSYSQDQTADEGGDMGFLHSGMLHQDVEKILDTMQLDEISMPIRLLEGYVLVKLNDTKSARLYPFKEVEPKARKLLTQQIADKAWQDFLQSLRDHTEIKLSDKLTHLALE